MGSEYDTGKIRELARQVGRVAEDVADIRSRTENAVRQEIPDNFAGSAADALIPISSRSVRCASWRGSYADKSDPAA